MRGVRDGLSTIEGLSAMNVQLMQAFIGYLRTHKLMEQTDIIKVVKHMQQLDRRVGAYAMARGFVTPENVSKIVLQQTVVNKRFCELGVEMGHITTEQSNDLLRIQKDDLFAFCQTAVIAKVRSLPDMIGYLKPFLAANKPTSADGAPEDAPAKMGANIRQVLQKIKGVAPLPGVVTKVIEMLDDPKTTMESVGKVIIMDAGLATTLLRIVNSAFYGLRSQAKNLTQALVILGTKKIKELVLVAGVMHKFRDVPADKAKVFWERSLNAAQWMKELGAAHKVPDVDIMFINGFIHNVGELIILQHFAAESNEIHALIAGGMDQTSAERKVLGATHADISAFLFEVWQFPPAVIQGAMIHHMPISTLAQMKTIRPEAIIVNLASRIVDIDPQMDPFERVAKLNEILPEYQSVLKFENLVIEDMMVSVQKNVGELKKFFGFV